MEKVILVDEHDREIGLEEKLQAHIDGKLHRAISVFIFNDQQEMLLQRRALHKYHCGGLWSNTCCSHPRPGENVLAAAERRLYEEMGIRCALKKVSEFVYRAPLENGLIEHEFDHVFVGISNVDPMPNPEEACDWKWIDMDSLREDIRLNPKKYTYWFKEILDKNLVFAL